MKSLVRRIQLSVLAALWPLAALAAGPGNDIDPSELHDSDHSGGGHDATDVSDHIDDSAAPDTADVSDHDTTAPEDAAAADDHDTSTPDDTADHDSTEASADDDHRSSGGPDDTADHESGGDHGSSGGSDYESGSTSGGSGDSSEYSAASGGADTYYESGSSGGSGGSGSSGDSGAHYESGSSDGSGSSGSNSGSGSSGSDDGGSSGSSGGHSGSGSSGGDDGGSSGSSGSGESGSSGSSGSNSGSGSSGSGETGSSGSSGSNSGASADANASNNAGSRLEIGRDERGHEHVSGEALLAGRDHDVAEAIAHGYQVIALQQAPSIGRTLARLRVPENTSVEAAVLELHRLAPGALVTDNTVYRDAQSNISISSLPARPVRATPLRGELGIIDTGANADALDTPNVLVGQRSFAGSYTPRDHGTIVAQLASRMGMRVRVADVFGIGSDGSLAASADSLIGALDWMVANNVAVINISIEGPRNAILEQEIRAATQRGHVIVAAAGNGGPMAAPAFPAAYDGAVAVTAVDGAGHAYRRANRGSYVAFAAAGVNIDVALGDHQVTVSGTSFSSPIVASQIAALMRGPSPGQAHRALQALQLQAIDLGAPGRDPVFGWGAINPSE